MNITPADIISILGAITAIYIAVSGGKKTNAETRKASADAAESYRKLADSCADKQVELLDKIDQLNIKIDRMENQLDAKDARIAELETLTKAQEARIKELEAEVDALQRKRK
jgi:peptidoglycan hydrolase CwlO-like protein